MKVSVLDQLEITDSRPTGDGFLAVKGRLARAGMYEYTRRELRLDGDPNEIMKIWRSEATVFSDENMATFAHRPVTLGHPPVFVDSKNWKQYSKGHIGSKVRRDGDFVEVDMLLLDSEAVDAVNSGVVQISAGYVADIRMGASATPDGQHFDGEMIGPFKGNHAAILPRGRAGEDCRVMVGDAWPEEITPPKKEVKVKTILIDGVPYNQDNLDGVEAAVKKVEDRAVRAETALEAANKALSDANTAHASALADATKAHDKAMGAKDAEIETLKASALDQAAIDKLADAKADTVAAARKALGDKAPDFAGKSVAEVRRATVAVKFGDAAVADKSDDYVEARFDAMVATDTAAPVMDAYQQGMSGRTVIDFGDAKAKADAAFAASLTA